jgi:voltage-gated potassium channel
VPDQRQPLARFSLQAQLDRAGTQPLGPFLRRLAALGGLICLMLLAGTVGFIVTLDKSAWGGFVLALDTIATIGSIPQPDDTGAQVVKVLLTVLGVGTLFYALVTVTEFFVAGHLTGLLSQRRALRMTRSLSDHHLICGFGRVGRQVARDLKAARDAFVVIDSNPNNRELCEQMGATFIEGAPSDDEVLRQAGIERAQSVIACMDSDAENIFTALTARELRADIMVVARASMEHSEKKLKRAGADRVISPYKASGNVMARFALHPQVAGIVDVAPEYRMEEIEVTAECPGAGRTIEDIRGASIIVALRRNGALVPQPAWDTEVQAGDVLIAMGTPGAMDTLESLFARA